VGAKRSIITWSERGELANRGGPNGGTRCGCLRQTGKAVCLATAMRQRSDAFRTMTETIEFIEQYAKIMSAPVRTIRA
jgi:hypothetical protein